MKVCFIGQMTRVSSKGWDVVRTLLTYSAYKQHVPTLYSVLILEYNHELFNMYMMFHTRTESLR